MKLKTIDNFLDLKDFEILKSLDLKKINDNEIKVYHNRVYKNEKIQAECLKENQLKDFHVKYHKKALDILNTLNPSKVNLYDFSEFHIIETGANYKFPIHDDTPNKLLSGVVYIKPEENTGTIFYENKKGEGKKIISWKQNRGIFFSRIEGQSWHSYEGNGKANRVVLVYNLMTNRIKEVYKAEKKNYYLGIFRYWINPYLYKIFKFTI